MSAVGKRTRPDPDRREALLIERIARERGELAMLAARLSKPVRRAEALKEQLKSAFWYLLPWLPLVAILLVRPGRALRWGTRLLGAYQTLRRVRALVS